MASQKTFLILDGNALLHRAWHAIPPLTTKDGRMVNAVYGFAIVVEKMRSELAPDFMAVAWDLPGGTFRHVEYAEYKATREKKAQELYDQIPMIQTLLSTYEIPSLSAPGFEGDDILGTISAMNEKEGVKTLIVTGDLDALQLVSPMTDVVFFVKGLSQTTRYTVDAVKARYDLFPAELIDYKTLVGDNSDNLPGIKGIGEKGAVDLLHRYKTVDGIFEALHDNLLPDKFVKKFQGQEETATLMKRMVTIVRDVPLPHFSREASITKTPDLTKVIPMLESFEFYSIIKKLDASSKALDHRSFNEDGLAKEESPSSPSKPVAQLAQGGNPPIAQVVIHDRPTITPPIAQPAARPAPRAASLPAGSLSSFELDRIGIVVQPKGTDLFGDSIASLALTDGRNTVAIPNPSTIDLQQVIVVLSSSKLFIAHDIKLILHIFADAGADVSSLLRHPCFDTQVAAYLIASADREFAFTDIVKSVLGASLPPESSAKDLIGALLPLMTALSRRLEDEGMLKLANDVEFPLIGVLFAMEQNGFAVDKEKLGTLSKLFDDRLQELTISIHTDAKREFNINSPSQLADVLFIDLAIPTKKIKKTKTGFSTAASELEKIVDLHPIVAKISEYRELAKLKGTYADALPRLVQADGRIHARFNQCVAATGRLSGSDPNLQNIPIRSDLGKEIRKAFIAPKGSVLLSADYSQIELRLAASIAKDASFIAAFNDGADIHKRTAAEMWGIEESAVTKEQRYAAKAINFGILYGIGPRSLGKSAGISFEEAREFIDRYFVAHPGIAAYLDATKLQAHHDGFVSSLFGRRRYLPDVNSPMPQLIASAERMAINMPIQATQADIIKMAMNSVADYLRTSNIGAKMIAQVHDELVFEVKKESAADLGDNIRRIMSSIAQFDVPLVVDIATADSWGDME